MADQRKRRRIKKNAAHSTVLNVETSSSSDTEELFRPFVTGRPRVDVAFERGESVDESEGGSQASGVSLDEQLTGRTDSHDDAVQQDTGGSDAIEDPHDEQGLQQDTGRSDNSEGEAVQSERSVSPEMTPPEVHHTGDSGESDSTHQSWTSTESDFPDTESEEEEELVEGDRPLYHGAPLTVGESLLAIMTLVISHSLTGQCLSDLLNLIALHCPVGNLCKSSLYRFKKYFSDVGKSLLVFHYYCSGCVVPLPSQDSMCHLCQGEQSVSFFIELPILFQLQSMFMRANFLEDLQFRFRRNKRNLNNIEDNYDGRIYQEHLSSGFLSNPNNISMMWYSDGMSIFKSSKFSIWPLYLVINELSYKKRVKKDNIILAGLWFRESKPNPNVFLSPFHTALNQLSTEGHYFDLPNKEPILVKCMLLCGTCDLPAKNLFMNFKQYNAYYGCTRCLSEGARYAVGNTSVHVHPYNENIELRKHDEVATFAEMANATGQSVMGVKGLSPLYFMVPDVIKCHALDVMHGVFSGVCKLLTHLWFDPAYSQCHFSLSGLVDLVDMRILKLRPPSFVQRMPRSIKHTLNLWKASEFKLWMLYYSIPVLVGILEDGYLNHHVRLVSAIYLLSQESVSHEQVEIASKLMHSYVKDFQELYGLRYLGMNVHQLLHFPELWVYSCFFLEDLNGKLGKLFHGTTHIGVQICSVALIYLNLDVMIEKLPASATRSFCQKLTSEKRSIKIADELVIGGSLYCAVGKIFHLPALPPFIRAAMINSSQEVDGNFHLFYRLRKKGIIYFSEGYMKSNKKLSTFASYTWHNTSKLCCTNYFLRRSTCHCNRNCQCPASYFVIATIYDRLAWLVHKIENVRMSYAKSFALKSR